MSKEKRIDILCVVITVLSLAVTVLFMNGDSLGIKRAENSSAMYSAEDLEEVDFTKAAKITLSQSSAEISGSGAESDKGKVNITSGGSYVISGEFAGEITVNTDKDSVVNILLDGVKISAADSAALTVGQAKKVFITLAEGSENSLNGAEAYSAEAAAAGIDGVIYSKDDITLNGKGSLTVNAPCGHGIVCNDNLIITGGTLNVTAGQDAIHANDSFRLSEASLSLTAGDDGISVKNDGDTSFIVIDSGSVNITECVEGIEAHNITVNGGKIQAGFTDDGLNACGDSTALVTVNDGDITLLSPDGRDADGIDSNGDIVFNGGKTFISVNGSGSNCALDCGSESGGKCTVNGGTVIACGGSAMAEGFGEGSLQGSVMENVSGSAGCKITLKDKDGNVLINETVPNSFSCAVLSAPGMTVGDTCTLSIDGTETELEIKEASGGSGGSFGNFGGGGMHSPPMQGGERPSMPDGEMPSIPDGEMPSIPDGEMPSMPDGEMPSMPDGEMPSMPDGEMPSMPDGEPPEAPPGGFGNFGGPGEGRGGPPGQGGPGGNGFGRN